MPTPTCTLDAADVSRAIEMAWEDRTPFEAIKSQFGLDEAAVIALMRLHLKPGSFRLWRERVQGRKTKHAALRRSRQLNGGARPAPVRRRRAGLRAQSANTDGFGVIEKV